MFQPRHPIHWRELPFVRILLPFLGGLLVYHYGILAYRVAPIYLIFIFILPLASLIIQLQKTGIYYLFWFIFICLFGHQISAYTDQTQNPDHYLNIGNTEGYFGKIKKTKEKENTIHLETNLLQTSTGKALSGKTLIYLKKQNEIPGAGDYIAFNKDLQHPMARQNPESFDYSGYLAQRDIYRVVYLTEGEYQVITSQTKINWAQRLAGFRQQLLSIFREHFTDPKHFQLAAAMVLGYRAEMDQDLRDQFATIGLMHILAVSGLHIGIVFSVLYFIFNRRPGGIISLLLILSGIWFYVLLTGAPASAVRAGFLFSILQIGKSIRRDASIYNSLAAAAFCLLLWQPKWIFDIGFQLSFSAVWGIIYFQPKIVRWFTFENRFLDYGWQITSVSIAAQLVTTPISLFYFQQFPIYFWLSGMIGLPLAPVILIGGILLLLLGLFIPSIAGLLGILLDRVIAILIGSTRYIAELPGSRIGQEQYVSGGELLILYFLLVMLIMWLETRHRNWFFILLIAGWAFMAGRTGRDMQRKPLITFYAVRDGLMVDHFFGNQSMRITNLPPDETREYAAAGWQVRHGIRSDYLEDLHPDSSRYTSTLLHYRQYVSFCGLYWRIIDERVRWEENSTMPTDIWFISDYRVPPSISDSICFPRLIICAGGTGKKGAKKWKAWAETNGIRFHNLYQNGAIWLQKKAESWEIGQLYPPEKRGDLDVK